MGNIIKFEGSDKSTDYVARMQSENLSNADAAEIQQWCDAHPDNQENLTELLDLLADVESLSDHPDMCSAIEEQSAAGSLLRRRSWPAWSVAAVVLIAVTVSIGRWLFLTPQEGDEFQSARYVTRIGEQRNISLPDGSVINMNTNSEILVEFGTDFRRIGLTRGEAFFAVARDPERPFSVAVDERAVTVLGTEFNVIKAPGEFTLSVVEGVVVLHRTTDSDIDAVTELTVPVEGKNTFDILNPQLVKAGTVANVVAANQMAVVTRLQDLEQFGWRDGMLSFRNNPLSEVVKELNRYLAKPIIIKDAAAGALPILGVFQIERLETALTDLERMLPITVERFAENVVVSSKN